MTQHPLDFMHEEDCASRLELDFEFDETMQIPDINYLPFDDYQQVVIEFYAEQEQARAELSRSLVSADLIAAWDRAKVVR